MEPRLRKTTGRTYYESTIEDFVAYKSSSEIVDFLTESDEHSTLIIDKMYFKSYN